MASSGEGPGIGRRSSYRLVEIYVRRDRADDEGSVGSGYLLGNGLILTARHVLMPKSWGENTPRGLVIEARALAEGVAPTFRTAKLVWPQALTALSDRKAPDVALVRLPSIPAGAADRVRVAFGDDDDQPIIDVYAGGFPAHRDNMAGPGLRESKQILGRVPPLSGVRSGTFEITAIKMDGARDLDPNLKWEGISGSGLLARGGLLGVVITRAEGQGYDFRAVRLEQVLRNDLGFQRALAEGADFPGSELYPHLANVVDTLREAPADLVAWWFAHVSGLLGNNTLAQRGRSLSELVLTLADYPAVPDGGSFPLFTVLEGVAQDLLDDSGLKEVQTKLDAVALSQRVTSEGIERLRSHVDAARRRRLGADTEGGRGRAAERSILVVIEPDSEIKNPRHYFVRVYDWLPWESAAIEQSMGSRGRAVDGSEVGPSRTAEDLSSAKGRAEIGKEIGRRLRAIPMRARFVEFLVPGSLICADFDAIKVDVLGDEYMLELDDETAPMDISLGRWARVVVRPLDRWRPQFREGCKAFVDEWKERWRSMMNPAIEPSRACWWWKAGLDHERALEQLGSPENRYVGCIGLGFPPSNPEMARRVYRVLLAVGAPVAVWARDAVEVHAEELLKTIVDAAEPPDLRDRVYAHRTNLGEQVSNSQVPKALTLFWDDPGRPPPLPLQNHF